MSSAINFSNVGNLAGFIGTDWTAYTPTFTGFGTVTGISSYYKRDGGDVLLRINFTTGTNTAVEARISLPSGLTSAADIVSSEVSGAGWQGGNTTSIYAPAIQPSKSYIVFFRNTNPPLTVINGNNFFDSTVHTFLVRVPIAGWLSAGANIGTSYPTGWQLYTPTFLGLGTVTNIFTRWRATSSDSIEIGGYFTAGTGTGVTASMSLPSGKTILASGLMGSSTHFCGPCVSTDNQTAQYTVLATASGTVVNFGYANGGASEPLTARLGNALFGASQRVSFTAIIPAQ